MNCNMCKWFMCTLILAIVTFMCGCAASPSRMDRLEQDITDLKQQLAQLQQSDKDNRALMDQLLKKLDAMLKNVSRTNADINSEVSTLLSEIRALQGEMENNAHKINMLIQQLNKLSGHPFESGTYEGGQPFADNQQQASPGQSAMTPLPENENTVVQFDEDKLYQNAYRDYLSGKYSLAIDGFNTFLQAFPESQLADNAQYWIGECYYSQKQFRRALSDFYQLTQKYPSGDKVPSAMLKIGLCYIELQLPKQAQETFEKLMQQFPTSNESIQAREKLKMLN